MNFKGVIHLSCLKQPLQDVMNHTLDSIGSTNENSLTLKDVHGDWLRQIEPKKSNMVGSLWSPLPILQRLAAYRWVIMGFLRAKTSKITSLSKDLGTLTSQWRIDGFWIIRMTFWSRCLSVILVLISLCVSYSICKIWIIILILSWPCLPLFIQIYKVLDKLKRIQMPNIISYVILLYYCHLFIDIFNSLWILTPVHLSSLSKYDM